MRKISKKIIILALILGAILPVFGGYRQSYAADDSVMKSKGSCSETMPSDRGFLGLLPWYAGLCKNGDSVTIPECKDSNGECDTLKYSILQIVFNILQDLAVVAAYLTIGFVIYGGYQYLLARGSTEKALNGKKTIITAFIGLAITMLASVIFSAIKFALTNGQGANTGNVTLSDGTVISGIPNVDPNLAFTSTLSWVISIAGLVAVIFIVYGGALYISSRGEPQKIETAKKTLMYSMIGLVLVGVSQAAIALVTNNIKAARDEAIKNATSQQQVITIAKKEK